MTNRIILILVSTLILLQLSCENRQNRIDNIHFLYVSSRRIPYNKIIIDVNFNNQKPILHLKSFPMEESPEWNYSKTDTSFSISLKQYSLISDALQRMLENKNIEKDSMNGVDGSEITLQFQVDSVNKKYKIWYPVYETKTRNLGEFLLVNKILAETAHLKTNLVEK